MVFNKTTIWVVLLLVMSMAVGVVAQPIGIPASGCQSGGIVTTEQFFNPGSGGFTQDKTILPGQTNVEIGAWTFVDELVLDPTAGLGAPNCPFAGIGDLRPLYVTKIAIRPVSGDPDALGVTQVTFWLDNNVDSFLNPGQDTQLSTLPGSCLKSSQGCVLSFGNAPIFGGSAGLGPRTPAGNPVGFCPFGCQSILVSVDIGTPTGGATLQVRVEGQASDITNNTVGGPVSSEFSPSFRQVGSSIRAVAEGTGTPPPPTGCPPGFTGTPPFCTPSTPPPPAALKGDVNQNGILDRGDLKLLKQAVSGRASLSAAQQLAAQVAQPCTGAPDRLDTKQLGLMIKGRGSSQCTGASASAQSLSAGQGDFYAPEFLTSAVNNGSGNTETGVIKVELSGIRTRDDRGSLSGSPSRNAQPSDREYVVGMVQYCDGGLPIVAQASVLPVIASATVAIAGFGAALPCVFSGGPTDLKPTNLVRVRVGISGTGAQFVQAIRVYADTDFDRRLFEPAELLFTQIPTNGVASFGSLQQTLTTSGGVPLTLPDRFPFGQLLYVTLDIDSRATASQVDAEIVVDVADIPGTPSSRLINSAPTTFTFQIDGPPGGTPPPPGGGCPPGFTGTPPFCTPSTPPPPAALKGDVNQNGILDRGDLKLLKQAVSGRASLSAAQQLAAQVAQPCTGAPDRLDTKQLGLMIKGRGSSQCTASSGFEQAFEPLSLGSVSLVRSGHGVQFALSGSGIQQAQVQVLDLSGGVVYDSGTTNPYALRWNLLDASGAKVANGVYLYVVRVVGANGQLVSKVSKLAIVK